MIASCEKELDDVKDSASFDLGVCLGILKGLHYLSPDVCIPSSVSLLDIALVLAKYFRSHPEHRQKTDFRERSLEGMRSAWPCGSRKNI